MLQARLAAGISSSVVKPIASSRDPLATAELQVRRPSYFGRFASIALFHCPPGARHTLSELWMGDFARVVPAGWHFASPLALHIEFRRVSNSEFLVPNPLFAAVRAWARPQPTVS